jgi:Reverse transcriptase (RNA-dependent DNA polymerase)
MHKPDLLQSAYRALLTDTLPYEVPVIFSNDLFFLTEVGEIQSGSTDPSSLELRNCLHRLRGSVPNFTIPYTYDIAKGPDSWTRLSIVHPRIQLVFCEFYARYSSSIIANCSRSEYSLRYPDRVVAPFVEQNAGPNRSSMKEGVVQVEDHENEFSHITSFFSYQKYNLLGKFIDSTEYIRLEKRFLKMRTVDVSKCFFNIYSHSISWAVKDKEFAKENSNAHSFENTFDKMMQKANYSETNGIVVGPEISRIFAEIIFQEIDRLLYNQLRKSDAALSEGREYSVRRYVDDYFIFANKEEHIDIIEKTLRSKLEDFKLFLNDRKVLSSERPFVSALSLARREINDTLDDLRHMLDDNNLQQTDSNLRHLRRLVSRSIRDIRLVVTRYGVEIGKISSWILSALKNLIVKACSLASVFQSEIENLTGLVEALLSGVFYICALDPRVRTTYNICQVVFSVSEWASGYGQDVLDRINHLISEELVSIVKSMRLREESRENSATDNVELYNLLICGAQFIGEDFIYAPDISDVLNSLLEVKKLTYFRYIAVKFCLLKDKKNRYAGALGIINIKARQHILDRKMNLSRDTEGYLMFCDYLSAPDITDPDKRILFQEVFSGQISNATARRLGTCVGFTDWTGLRIQHLLRRKELRPVYALV